MAESLVVDALGELSVVRFKDPSMLDALAIQRIGQELQQVIETSLSKKLVLNFNGIRFLSSEALRVLIGLRAKIDKAGRQVVLCGIRPELLRVFQLTNLDKLFAICEDVEAAKKKLGV